MITYPLAPQAVFATVQGEGDLLGLPMIFIRLAGCSEKCKFCDTDYSVASRAGVEEILSRVSALRYPGTKWVWITGGEPLDHDLVPLLLGLRKLPLFTALATAGSHELPPAYLVDFVSVSPHDPSRWRVRRGKSLNLVPGLGGFHLIDFMDRIEEYDVLENFGTCWVTPCDGLPETLAECQRWIRTFPGYRLGVQAHKQWDLP